MTTGSCTHCHTEVAADAAACPKCGAKRKSVEMETGSGKLKFNAFHAIAGVGGFIAGYFIAQVVHKPPIGVGTIFSTMMLSAFACGLVARFVVPPKVETKLKTIWVRQDF